jgi:hypothetical protein
MNRQHNAMDRVAMARRAALDPAPDPERRLADLARALAEPSPFSSSDAPRSAPVGARTHRSRLVLGLSAAATVAAVAAVIATSGLESAGPTANGTGAAETASTGTNSRATDQRATRILLVAADHVATAAPSGRYWRTTTDLYALELAGPARHPYVIRSGDREQNWVARSDSDPNWGAGKSLGREPASAADRAAWQADGSPTTFAVREPVSQQVITVPAAGTKWVVQETNSGSKVFFVGHDLTMSQIRALPADPSRLRTFLMTDFRRSVKAGREYPLAGTWTQDSWLFDNASSLLTLPVSPEVRASAYRIMAEVKGVRSLGSVPDLTGRVGDAVAVRGSNSLGEFEKRIIIDPATGLMLADEIRYLKPIERLSWAKPTDVWQSTVFIDVGWTNDKPPAPTGDGPSGKGVG